jgi:hypothetical protein
VAQLRLFTPGYPRIANGKENNNTTITKEIVPQKLVLVLFHMKNRLGA